jgi:citrate lyase subunit beta/citryl-CoA lyase
VRINAPGTPWHEADIDALTSFGVRHICLPKVDSTAVLDGLAARLGNDLVVMVQIENARGVENAAAIVAHPMVSQLAFGPADFFLDMGVSAGGALTRHVLSRLAIASRSAGKSRPLDGPSFNLADGEKLLAECAAAAACGAGGKLCIHPSQVPHVLAAFRPSPAELDWARRVVDADRDGSAQIVDGRMIDAPIIARARALLGGAE